MRRAGQRFKVVVHLATKVLQVRSEEFDDVQRGFRAY
jgi:hypothetical protein